MKYRGALTGLKRTKSRSPSPALSDFSAFSSPCPLEQAGASASKQAAQVAVTTVVAARGCMLRGSLSHGVGHIDGRLTEVVEHAQILRARFEEGALRLEQV